MVFMAKVPAARVREILQAALKAEAVRDIAFLTPEEVVRLAYEVLETRPKESHE
jgi:hypothetical protein